jgi:hypothetical protein
MATPNNNQITAPRVDLIDETTGKIRREWYMFLYNLYTITGAGSGITPVINGGTGLGTIPTNGQLLIGNGTGYTLNTLGYGAGISVTNGSGTITVANTGVLSNIAGTGISVSSATGDVTIANTGVLSVTGTAPVVSSGGQNPAISMPAASSTVDGYLTSTDWNTFNNKQSVAAPVTKTADFTVAATDLWIINNKSGSTCTVTLPAAASYVGRQLTFQNYQAQTLVSASSNVVPQSGGSAGTAILLNVAGNWATMVSDGTNWVIMQAASNNNLLLE